MRLRTNIRRDPPEGARVDRVMAQADVVRDLFPTHVVALNTLDERPSWDNSATTNCIAAIGRHSVANPARVPFSWKILIAGFRPECLHEQGRLDPRYRVEELRARGHGKTAAPAADGESAFARRIRHGIPGCATRD